MAFWFRWLGGRHRFEGQGCRTGRELSSRATGDSGLVESGGMLSARGRASLGAGSEKRLWAQICTCLDEGRLGRIGFGRLRPHDESCGGISAARGAGWTIMMGIM